MKRKLKFCALLVTVALTLNVSYVEKGDSSISVADTGVLQELTSEPIMVYAQDVTNSTVITDSEFGKQWALYNDGSFCVDDQPKDFPVYENPFDEPMNRGNMPTREPFMKRMNYFSTAMAYTQMNSSVTAVSGIDINMEPAWEEYNGGVRDVIVALIDTGIDYSHEDLQDILWVNEDEIAGDGIDNDGNGYIDDVNGWNFYSNSNQIFVGSEDSHGTHGAGTIAANLNALGIAGIAGNSTIKIMSIKALGGEDGSGTTDAIINAIKYAQDNGAVICNLSFGTTTNDTELEKVMEDSNMLFIAAAGNGDNWTGTGSNNDRTPTYPAAYDMDNIIAVANLQCDGTLHSSSNYGTTSVDIAAPGTNILSTTTNNSYSYMTGTSMAAPMVTGVAAMLYSQYKDITLDQVKGVILNSAKSLSSLNGYVATGGMLDAYAALTYDYTSIEEDAKSSTEEETKTSSTAPVISAKISRQMNGLILNIKVTDAQKDIVAVRYMNGNVGKEAFTSGTSGYEVNLNNGSVSYRIIGSGSFTFYAIDADGNETVKTVTID